MVTPPGFSFLSGPAGPWPEVAPGRTGEPGRDGPRRRRAATAGVPNLTQNARVPNLTYVLARASSCRPLSARHLLIAPIVLFCTTVEVVHRLAAIQALPEAPQGCSTPAY